MRIVGRENRDHYSDALHDEAEIVPQELGQRAHFPVDAHFL